MDLEKGNTANTLQIGFFIPGHISEVDPSEVSGTTSPKLPSNSEEVHVAEEKLDSSTETPASKVGDAESSEVSQSTGHPSTTRESIHTRMGLEDTSDRNILQAQLAESALEPAEPEESLAIEEVLVTTSNEADKESAAVIEARLTTFEIVSGLAFGKSRTTAMFLYVVTLQATHTFAHAHEGRKLSLFIICFRLDAVISIFLNSLVAKDVSKTVFSSMSWALFRTPTFLKKLEN
ncbi:hypothetical protein ACJX0J_039551 [Zea mays]